MVGVRWSGWFAALVVYAGLMEPAAAQGFLQNLFGWVSPGASQPPATMPPAGLPSPYSYREPLFDPYRRDLRNDDPFRDVDGVYRTLCVRLCDGYYWPLSQATGRNGLERDAQTCRSSCGQEARLFYLGSKAGDAMDMIDLQGRPYTSLPTAFRYRKKLVDGCFCRPEPWSASERDRHRRYALEAPTAERTSGNPVSFSGPPIPPLPPDARVARAAPEETDRTAEAPAGDLPSEPRNAVTPALQVATPPVTRPRLEPRLPGPVSVKAPRPGAVGTSGPLSGTTWPGG